MLFFCVSYIDMAYINNNNIDDETKKKKKKKKTVLTHKRTNGGTTYIFFAAKFRNIYIAYVLFMPVRFRRQVNDDLYV